MARSEMDEITNDRTLEDYLAVDIPDDGSDDETRADDVAEQVDDADDEPWRVEKELKILSRAIELEALSESRPIHMNVVGAWAGSMTRSDPPFWVGFARALRLNRLDLMVNDHSGRTGCAPFDCASADAIARVAELCTQAGITLHLTSWIMPCRRYIERAAELLLPILRDQPIASLVWDAERPWTGTNGDMTWADAGALVGDLFGSVPLGVTAIVEMFDRKIRPLADRSQHFVPMAYATVKNGYDPRRLVIRGRDRWAAKLGRAPALMGLAAYRQDADDPIPRMQAAIAAVAACGIDTVCYWSLRDIQRRPAIARFVRALRAP